MHADMHNDDGSHSTMWKNIFRLVNFASRVFRTAKGTMPELVQYRSPKLVCMHEAGHAIAALSIGARVVEMELYLDPPPPYGRSRIERDDSQRQIIALGGFAVERRLWEASRLVWPDDRKPTEPQMLSESIDNADKDRVFYFGSDYRRESGTWPPEMDLQFMMAAQELGKKLDLSAVERLASALLTDIRLEEARIREIVGF